MVTLQVSVVMMQLTRSPMMTSKASGFSVVASLAVRTDSVLVVSPSAKLTATGLMPV